MWLSGLVGNYCWGLSLVILGECFLWVLFNVQLQTLIELLESFGEVKRRGRIFIKSVSCVVYMKKFIKLYSFFQVETKVN